ncbi:MAG: UDP-N-acetylmuramate:L-alanyl-gamma-D-glutamyl-me so-diaminopimelate ligase [Calditrichia bacterium]
MILNEHYKKIHLIGISGTGMTALTNLLVQSGFMVSGSDIAFYPPMGEFLKSLPIKLYEGYNSKNLTDAQPDVIIVGNAISRGNPELEYALEKRMVMLSLPQAMHHIYLYKSRNIVVTGTHGKTTTTSLVSHILQAPGYNASYFCGGIPLNFGTPSKLGDPELFVLEGDEYDSAYFDKSPKFMKYNPYILILNNIEFDHADIYPSLDDIIRQFYYVTRLVPSNGTIVANGDDANVQQVLKGAHAPIITYGQQSDNDVRFKITQKGNKFFLQIITEKNNEYFIEMNFPMTGLAYNMTASFIAARAMGCSIEQIIAGLASFRGVKRRLEQVAVTDKFIIFDDFAHHPTAVKTTLHALKKKYANDRLIAIFEPRSNTSIRNIFSSDYAEALQIADVVFLAPPFQKKSQQIESPLDLQTIQGKLQKHGTICKIGEDYHDLLGKVRDSLPDSGIVVLMSNGSFEPFKSRFIDYMLHRMIS